MPHSDFTLFAAAVLATGLALLENRTVRQRIYHAVYMFLCCTLAVVAGGWLMHLVHG
jgi:hypothetical protein